MYLFDLSLVWGSGGGVWVLCRSFDPVVFKSDSNALTHNHKSLRFNPNCPYTGQHRRGTTLRLNNITLTYVLKQGSPDMSCVLMITCGEKDNGPFSLTHKDQICKLQTEAEVGV